MDLDKISDMLGFDFTVLEEITVHGSIPGSLTKVLWIKFQCPPVDACYILICSEMCEEVPCMHVESAADIRIVDLKVEYLNFCYENAGKSEGYLMHSFISQISQRLVDKEWLGQREGFSLDKKMLARIFGVSEDDNVLRVVLQQFLMSKNIWLALLPREF